MCMNIKKWESFASPTSSNRSLFAVIIIAPGIAFLLFLYLILILLQRRVLTSCCMHTQREFYVQRVDDDDDEKHSTLAAKKIIKYIRRFSLCFSLFHSFRKLVSWQSLWGCYSTPLSAPFCLLYVYTIIIMCYGKETKLLLATSLDRIRFVARSCSWTRCREFLDLTQYFWVKLFFSCSACSTTQQNESIFIAFWMGGLFWKFKWKNVFVHKMLRLCAVKNEQKCANKLDGKSSLFFWGNGSCILLQSFSHDRGKWHLYEREITWENIFEWGHHSWGVKNYLVEFNSHDNLSSICIHCPILRLIINFIVHVKYIQYIFNKNHIHTGSFKYLQAHSDTTICLFKATLLSLCQREM